MKKPTKTKYEVSIEVEVEAMPQLFKAVSEICKHGRLVSIIDTVDLDDDF